jgi:hypothetical protein
LILRFNRYSMSYMVLLVTAGFRSINNMGRGALVLECWIFQMFSTVWPSSSIAYFRSLVLKLVVCILLHVLGQVQGFRLTQHWFEYFIQ